LANVSTAVVSAVVNGEFTRGVRVSAATKARVEEAVRQLGYLPNVAARNLAHGRNQIIGVFTYQPVFPVDSNNFYHEFLVGVEEEAELAGYNLLFFSAAKTVAGARSIYGAGVNALQLADGAVLVGTREDHEEIARLRSENYPFVVIGRREMPGVEISYVAADYLTGTCAAVGELVTLGHRRIALVHEVPNHESKLDRYAGFMRARSEYSLAERDTPTVVMSDDTPLRTILSRLADGGVTAALIERTPSTRSMLDEARRAAISVPGEMSLVSLGDDPSIEGDRGMATMRMPRREMGRTAVQLLLKSLGNASPAPLRAVLPCDLEMTGSVAPPRPDPPSGRARGSGDRSPMPASDLTD
jgi:DNA-binding LacI/PurR family transcriptional regulator